MKDQIFVQLFYKFLTFFLNDFPFLQRKPDVFRLSLESVPISRSIPGYFAGIPRSLH